MLKLAFAQGSSLFLFLSDFKTNSFSYPFHLWNNAIQFKFCLKKKNYLLDCNNDHSFISIFKISRLLLFSISCLSRWIYLGKNKTVPWRMVARARPQSPPSLRTRIVISQSWKHLLTTNTFNNQTVWNVLLRMSALQKTAMQNEDGSTRRPSR